VNEVVKSYQYVHRERDLGRPLIHTPMGGVFGG
jgi:hypothetical protein